MEAPTFCVGLPKAGTHSLAGLLDPACRVSHEPRIEELLAWVQARRDGRLSARALRRRLRRRHRALGLDVECSHLLAEVLPDLLHVVPEARVVLLVREPRSWVDSMINDQLNLREWERYRAFEPLYDLYFDDGQAAFPPEEHPLEVRGLYPLASYLRYWRERIELVERTVEPARLLTVPTEQLTADPRPIVSFLGLDGADLDVAAAHAHRARRRHGVLDSIDADHVERTIEVQAGATRRRLFGAG